MDSGTLRMLRTLPDNLTKMGWGFVPLTRRPSSRLSGKVYTVTYERPFEEGIDQYVPGEVLNGRLHITTKSNESWEEARNLAIAAMSHRDSRRKS